jgi:hypothetical protein
MPPRKRAESKPAEPKAAEDTPETPGQPLTDPSIPEEPTPPAKSDLQTVDQPCGECFPTGWTDMAFSQGCEHGTWIRP